MLLTLQFKPFLLQTLKHFVHREVPIQLQDIQRSLINLFLVAVLKVFIPRFEIWAKPISSFGDKILNKNPNPPPPPPQKKKPTGLHCNLRVKCHEQKDFRTLFQFIGKMRQEPRMGYIVEPQQHVWSLLQREHNRACDAILSHTSIDS